MSERFPATLELIIPASILALLIGVYGGTLAASKRKKSLDFSLRIYSVIIYSLPIFWLGLVLQLFFGVRLKWLPISGRIDSIIGTSLKPITNIYSLDVVTRSERAGFPFRSPAPGTSNPHTGIDPVGCFRAHDPH